MTAGLDGVILRLKFQDVSRNLKEKILHQLVSNLRTIAEPFIVLNNMAEVFYASLKIIANNCFSIIYENKGGGR